LTLNVDQSYEVNNNKNDEKNDNNKTNNKNERKNDKIRYIFIFFCETLIAFANAIRKNITNYKCVMFENKDASIILTNIYYFLLVAF
jgi:hypothetical protein